MTGKLILPAEVKVCATCSYWDGKRSVDPDIKVVVVDENVQGECLLHAQQMQGLWDTRQDPDCLWEDLMPDQD